MALEGTVSGTYPWVLLAAAHCSRNLALRKLCPLGQWHCRSQVLEKPGSGEAFVPQEPAVHAHRNWEAKPFPPAISLQCPLLTKLNIVPDAFSLYCQTR